MFFTITISFSFYVVPLLVVKGLAFQYDNLIHISCTLLHLFYSSAFSAVKDGPSVSWQSPKTEMIVDFLVFHQNWEPSYIRQRILPMLSTIYLREMAITPIKALLHGQYEFHSIHRVKIRFGYPCYVVKWKKAACSVSSAVYKTSDGECDLHQEEFTDGSEPFDLLDESNNPQIFVNDGCWVLLTDENSELVRSAFPDQVDRFLLDKVRFISNILF